MPYLHKALIWLMLINVSHTYYTYHNPVAFWYDKQIVYLIYIYTVVVV